MEYHEGEYLLNFERYAQILSQNFNVNIFLDGVKAETHQDNSIYLPNIKNIKEDELEYLYGILLHEVGHVKYSDFDKKEFKKLQGELHFMMWNAVEDARVENKLINKFDGANNIFQDMYMVYHPKLTKKIFERPEKPQKVSKAKLTPEQLAELAKEDAIWEAKLEEMKRWHAFAVHVHDYLLKTRKPVGTLEHHPEPLKKKVEKMFSEVKNVLDNNRLLTAGDAFSIATKIYKHFYKKETEEHSALKDAVEDLEKCKKELQKVYESFKENQNLQKLKSEKKELDKERRTLKKQMEASPDAKIFEKASESLDKIQDVQDLHDVNSKVSQFTSEVADAKKEFDQKNQQLDDLKSKIEELKKQKDALKGAKDAPEEEEVEKSEEQEETGEEAEESQETSQPQSSAQPEEAKAPESEPQDSKTKAANLRKEIKETRELIKKLNKQVTQVKRRLAKKEKHLDKKKKESEEMSKELKKNPYSDMTKEELDKKEAENQAIYDKLKEKMDTDYSQYRSVSDQIRQMRDEISKITKANRALLKKTLKSIEDKLGKNGMDKLDALPNFQENEDWPDGDKVQKEFDNKATNSSDDLVVNGVGKFHGERNIMMTIEKINEELEEIDLVKLFKKKMGFDEFENYNEYLSEIRNTDKIEDQDIQMVRRDYFPSTTKYDVVRSELKPANLNEITAIKSKYRTLINELSRILKIKLRNVKHIKFKGNQEEGIIDSRSVYKIPNGLDDHVFERAFPKPNDRVIVSVAIDISGSLDKDFTANGRKVKELAVIFDEALSKALIKHEVIGYGAPPDSDVEKVQGDSNIYARTRHRLETIVYRGFQGGNGLGNIELKCWDNADGENLRTVARRLLKTKSKNKIIINITDGKPFLHGTEAGILDYDLSKSIDWIKRNNIKIYSFGFNDYPKGFYGDKYLKLDEFNQLPKFFKDVK